MRRMMKKKQKQYLLIGLIVVCIFLMLGLGYALLSQNLDIKGTGTVTKGTLNAVLDAIKIKKKLRRLKKHQASNYHAVKTSYQGYFQVANTKHFLYRSKF